MVLVSDTYNFMYLVNPKTGSTSMRTYFKCYANHIKNSKYDIYNLYYKINGMPIKYNYSRDHNNSFTAKLMCETLNKDYNKYFSFIHIRNPWAKVVSIYFYDKPDKNRLGWYHTNYDKESAFYYNFNEWLKDRAICWSKIENWVFKHGEQQVTKIYPIETFTLKQLENDINEFNKERGTGAPILELDGELGHENTTVHDHYSTYYNEESIEIVRKTFAKDIELGGYTFESAPSKKIKSTRVLR
jgi:hypothetical protein